MEFDVILGPLQSRWLA